MNNVLEQQNSLPSTTQKTQTHNQRRKIRLYNWSYLESNPGPLIQGPQCKSLGPEIIA